MMEFGFGFGGGGPVREGSWQQRVLAKGWGYAIISPNSIQADNGAGLTRGIIGLCNKGQPRKVDDWGALRAWRGAVAALSIISRPTWRWTPSKSASRACRATARRRSLPWRTTSASPSASSARPAKAAPSCTVGTLANWWKTSPRPASTTGWPVTFSSTPAPLKWDDLPVDSHELVALCAPRPVFISCGSFKAEGGWVDAKGMFLAGVGAGPVYKLLGKKDLGSAEMPEQETALIDGEVAFRQHSGGHTTGPNWPTFLKFADRYLRTRSGVVGN